jgi:hypothetical protein
VRDVFWCGESVRSSDFNLIAKRYDGQRAINTLATDNIARVYTEIIGLSAWNLFVSASNSIAFTISNLYIEPLVWEIVDTATGWTRTGTLAGGTHYGGSVDSLIIAHGGDQFVVSFYTT